MRLQHGYNGMCASAHPLASLTGVEVLKRGGNAVDAAVAMAAVTGVVLPHMCGVGGDAFAIVRTKEGFCAMNGSGVAPLGATPEFFYDRGFSTMPLSGILSVAVPGAFRLLSDMHQRFGLMPWNELLSFAVFYAREGFPVTQELRRYIAQEKEKMNECARAVFVPGDRVPRVGERLVQADLAATLEKIAQEGADYVYTGEFFQRFMDQSKEAGGLFEGSEFPGQRTYMYTPIQTTYREWTIHETAPVSQGFMVLLSMNLLEPYPMSSLSEAERINLMVRAKKVAYSDRLKYAGDPEFVPFDVHHFISKEYAQAQQHRMEAPAGCEEPYMQGDTTYFAVADSTGMAVSFIHSLSLPFGSGVMVKGTGVILNNRAGRGFSLEKGHRNIIAPGKRTMHTLNCYMAEAPDGTLVVGGTPGGDGQPQWNMQVLSNIIDLGMDVQEAVSAPRWTSLPGTDPASMGTPDQLQIESRFSPETQTALSALGHKLVTTGPWGMGGAAQVVKVSPSGLLSAGSDPRAEGIALGY